MSSNMLPGVSTAPASSHIAPSLPSGWLPPAPWGQVRGPETEQHVEANTMGLERLAWGQQGDVVSQRSKWFGNPAHRECGGGNKTRYWMRWQRFCLMVKLPLHHHTQIIGGWCAFRAPYSKLNTLMILCSSLAPQNFLNSTIFSQGLPPREYRSSSPCYSYSEWCDFPSVPVNLEVSAEPVHFRQKRQYTQGNTSKNPSWAGKHLAMGTLNLKKLPGGMWLFFNISKNSLTAACYFQSHSRANIFQKLEPEVMLLNQRKFAALLLSTVFAKCSNK